MNLDSVDLATQQDCPLISYAADVCVLGHFLVACHEKAIVALLWGDGSAALLNSLRMRFSGCRFAPGGDASDTVPRIVAHAKEPWRAHRLTLRPAGTAFQKDVWARLCDIPAGHTLSYGALAQQIGRPGAARAVGAACGANPIGLLIPCHRAVGAGGRLVGYRWGVERKRAILEMEARAGSVAGENA